MPHYVSTKHVLSEALPKIDGLKLSVQQSVRDKQVLAVYSTHDGYTVHVEHLTEDEASRFVLGTFEDELWYYIQNAVLTRAGALYDLGLIEDAESTPTEGTAE